MDNPQTTVVISYNQVNGFRTGWHGDRNVFVCANNNGRGCSTGQGEDAHARASSVMHDLGHEYYKGSVPVSDVKEYFVYAGFYAFRSAIGMALELKRESGAPVTVVACGCEWAEKNRLLAEAGIPLLSCECGGERSLGRLVRERLPQP